MSRYRLDVKRIDWKGSKALAPGPANRIRAGSGCVILPFDKARRLVDYVHDLCDERERELREEQT